jgi:hypothetical protein
MPTYYDCHRAPARRLIAAPSTGGAVQQAAVAAAAAAAAAGAGAHASAAGATATAAAAAELRKRGRVRKLAPSDGWQTDGASGSGTAGGGGRAGGRGRRRSSLLCWRRTSE